MSDEVSLIGVYDADGSLSGELRYWVGARIGRAHCSLCDITHGLFREKQEWRDCRDALGISFTTFHRDDAPSDVLEACAHRLPIVVARAGGNVVEILGPEDLDGIGGDVEKFRNALLAGCERQGIGLD